MTFQYTFLVCIVYDYSLAYWVFIYKSMDNGCEWLFFFDHHWTSYLIFSLQLYIYVQLEIFSRLTSLRVLDLLLVKCLWVVTGYVLSFQIGCLFVLRILGILKDNDMRFLFCFHIGIWNLLPGLCWIDRLLNCCTLVSILCVLFELLFLQHSSEVYPLSVIHFR